VWLVVANTADLNKDRVYFKEIAIDCCVLYLKGDRDILPAESDQ